MKKKLNLCVEVAFLIIQMISFLLLISCKKTSSDVTQKEIAINRIVSLSPAATEIVFALGLQDKLVARTDFCDFPQEAKLISSLGGFDGKQISIEKIISLKPDLVLLTSGMHEYIINSLTSFGIDYLLLQSNNIEDIYCSIEKIGLKTNTFEKAMSVIEVIKKDILDNQDESVKTKVKVYFEVSEKPFISCGKNSFLNDVIESAGGINIFNDVVSSYPVISEESIFIRNPDVIVIPIYSDLQNKDEIKNKIIMRSNWKETSAIKNEKIIFVDGNLIERPGPRIGQAIKTLSLQLLNEKKNEIE